MNWECFLPRNLYYSIRNWLWYRKPRRPHMADLHEHLQGLLRSGPPYGVESSMQIIKDTITETLLRSVGLTIMDSLTSKADPSMPAHIYLTAIQCDAIGKVAGFGYRAKLR